MTTITLSDYARYLGVSRQWVSLRVKKRGKTQLLDFTRNGRVEQVRVVHKGNKLRLVKII